MKKMIYGGKEKSGMRKTILFLSVLLALVFVCSSALAIRYVDADGQTKNAADVEELGADSTEWTGWYMVTGEVTIAERITVNGEAHLILCDGAKLTASKGITVNSGNELTIYGQSGQSGQLISNCSSNYAGIGGTKGNACGKVTINGGLITVRGSGAGIGGGYNGAGGTITINGGKITATAGSGSAGIGGGKYGTGGTITINGGTITAIGRSGGAGIGGGDGGAGGGITINGGIINATTEGKLGAGIGGGYKSNGGTITIYGGQVNATGGGHAAGIGGGSTGSGGMITICGGEVNAAGGIDGAGIGGGYGRHGSGGNIIIKGGTVTASVNSESGTNTEAIGHGDYETIEECDSGTLTLAQMIVFAGSDADSVTMITGDEKAAGCRSKYVKLEPCPAHQYDENGICPACGDKEKQESHEVVSYRAVDGSMHSCDNWRELTSNMTCLSGSYSEWYVMTGENTIKERIDISGTVNLILCDGAKWTFKKGIHVPSGSELIIWQQNGTPGEITIKNTPKDHAGIGGNIGEDCGTIIINGGHIDVGRVYKSGSAAIGGGFQGSCGIIIINGGEITAEGELGAGIGNGRKCTSGGEITINGGKVTAKGKEDSSGIGGGYEGAGCDITINGGEVIASAAGSGAGIGTGRRGFDSRITINGGTVSATGGNNSAGIGGGPNNPDDEILINDGYITAVGDSAGIGSGKNGCDGNITINGGKIVATANNGVGIGGIAQDYDGQVTISGGIVTATSVSGGAGIGGGKECTGCTITISGGTVSATGSRYAAGIGGGQFGNGGTIIINGGTVIATGGFDAAGIGGGMCLSKREKGGGGTIIIRGGKVSAYGKGCACSIGPGSNSKGIEGPVGTVILSWKDLTDYIDAESIHASCEIERPFHYESADGQNKGPVTTYNLATKDAGYALVPNLGDAGLSIQAGNQTLQAGVSLDLTTTVTNPGEGTGTLTWHSGDPDIAQVDETSGRVTANSRGTVQIIAFYQSETTLGEASIELTVIAPGQITIHDPEHGSVTVDPDIETVLPETPVTLTVSPAAGYRLGRLTVTCGGEEIEITRVNENDDSQWTFPMPKSDVEVNAAFCQYYLIQFVQMDGTTVRILQELDLPADAVPEYSGETPTREEDEEYTYTFTGWNPRIVPVAGDVIYAAVFDKAPREYTVTFVNENGEVLQESGVGYGETPEYTGETLTKEADENGSYYFSRWEPEIEPVSGEATYTAVFEKVEILQEGANTVNLREYIPVMCSFTPTESTYYRFWSEPNASLPEFRIYDGDGMEEWGTFQIVDGGNCVFDCVAKLSGGKRYYAEIMSYNGDTEMTVHAEKVSVYSITVDGTSEHGMIECPATGYAGQSVEVIPNPEDGYALKRFIVTDAEGNVVEEDTHRFTMPASSVTVRAEFEKQMPVMFRTDDGIMFMMNMVSVEGRMYPWEEARAIENDTVEMDLACEDERYEIDSVSITKEDGTTVPCYLSMIEDEEGEEIGWTYWFIMPDQPVLVRVTRTRGEDEPEPEPEIEFDGDAFTLPTGLRTIEESAFEGDRSIFVAEIPKGCTSIGKWAFRGCTNLWMIRIPKGCTIGEDAFAGCGRVYVFSTADSDAYRYYTEHQENCGFIEE